VEYVLSRVGFDRKYAERDQRKMIAVEAIAFTLESNAEDSGVIQLRGADSVPDLEHPVVG
jgi:hypothetical protein